FDFGLPDTGTGVAIAAALGRPAIVNRKSQIENLLRRRRGAVAGVLGLALVPVVLLLELLDAAGGVHELHLAGEEGVAGRADFHRDVLARAAGGELVAAAAGHGRLFVLGVNALFHDRSSPSLSGSSDFKTIIVETASRTGQGQYVLDCGAIPPLSVFS